MDGVKPSLPKFDQISELAKHDPSKTVLRVATKEGRQVVIAEDRKVSWAVTRWLSSLVGGSYSTNKVIHTFQKISLTDLPEHKSLLAIFQNPETNERLTANLKELGFSKDKVNELSDAAFPVLGYLEEVRKGKGEGDKAFYQNLGLKVDVNTVNGFAKHLFLLGGRSSLLEEREGLTSQEGNAYIGKDISIRKMMLSSRIDTSHRIHALWNGTNGVEAKIGSMVGRGSFMKAWKVVNLATGDVAATLLNRPESRVAKDSATVLSTMLPYQSDTIKELTALQLELLTLPEGDSKIQEFTVKIDGLKVKLEGINTAIKMSLKEGNEEVNSSLKKYEEINKGGQIPNLVTLKRIPDPKHGHLGIDAIAAPLCEGDGNKLADVLRKLPGEEKVRLALQYTQALEQMHKNGWAHADQKPANLLFQKDSNGRYDLLVSDIGAAVEIDGTYDVGTRAFQSPERTKTGDGDKLKNEAYEMAMTLNNVLFQEFTHVFDNRVVYPANTEVQESLGMIKAPSPKDHSVEAELKRILRDLMIVNPKERLGIPEALQRLQKLMKE